MQYTPYILPGIVAFFVPLGFMVYMFRFRDAPAARPFSWLMGLTSLWTLCHILNIATVLLPLRMAWVYLQIVPFVLIAPTILLLALEYTGREQWLTRRRLLWLFAIPVITILLVWSSAHHPFYRYNYTLDLSGVVPLLRADKGGWYWVNLGYAYTLTLLACGLLLTAFPVGTPYFWNAAVIAVGVLLPFGADFLFIRGITPIPGYSVTPLVFIFTGALLMWAILRLRLFDLIPVARATMLEQMPEGVVVVDGRQRIVDVNPAAADMFGQPAAQLVGQAFAPENRFSGWRESLSDGNERPLEVTIGPRWYHINRSPLTDRRRARDGTLVVLRDVTDLKQAQMQFVEQQRALAMTNERVRLARELHDGLGQVLGYVKMRAQVARDLLAQGETAVLDDYLANLVAVSQEAHTDIREYLMGVKTATTAEPAFLQGLQHYLTQYSYHYGLHAQLHVAPEWHGRILSPTAEVQLLRIVQEALTNTRKHAQARQVQVCLSVQDEQARIRIQDDGRGFDRAQIHESGATYGLRFMCERAEELNGRFTVDSAPGQGTAVTVYIPL
jgi:PAS domain S-box-containing protein